jgi:hypothetical protein
MTDTHVSTYVSKLRQFIDFLTMPPDEDEVNCSGFFRLVT